MNTKTCVCLRAELINQTSVDCQHEIHSYDHSWVLSVGGSDVMVMWWSCDSHAMVMHPMWWSCDVMWWSCDPMWWSMWSHVMVMWWSCDSHAMVMWSHVMVMWCHVIPMGWLHKLYMIRGFCLQMADIQTVEWSNYTGIVCNSILEYWLFTAAWYVSHIVQLSPNMEILSLLPSYSSALTTVLLT